MVPATLNRLLLRGAVRIHDALATAGRESVPNLPETAWQELQGTCERLEQAVERSWTHAANHVRWEIEHSLSYLIRQLEEFRRNIAAQQASHKFYSPRDVHRELVALKTEFDEVRLDLKACTLTVVTDSIVLEHVNLGRFKIVLHWDRLDEDDTCEVLALDPHPTAGDSSTTHPHVRDERLCEGDGRLRFAARWPRVVFVTSLC